MPIRPCLDQVKGLWTKKSIRLKYRKPIHDEYTRNDEKNF
jgi:hypothetical protein